MSYNYQAERPFVLTDAGQKMMFAILQNARHLCKTAGCVRVDKALSCVTGDSWSQLACVDYLVEVKQLGWVLCDEARLTQHWILETLGT